MRIIAQFEKSAQHRFMSHLDVMRFFQRAIARAGLPVKYSAGFNPHPLLAFGPALSVGTAGLCELLDAQAEDIDPAEFAARLAEQTGGMRVTAAKAARDSFPALMAACEAADYTIELAEGVDGLTAKLADAMRQPILAVKKGKAGAKEVDLSGMIYGLAAPDDRTLSLRCACASGGGLNPNLLMAALRDALGAGDYLVTRTALLTFKDGGYASLFDSVE